MQTEENELGHGASGRTLLPLGAMLIAAFPAWSQQADPPANSPQTGQVVAQVKLAPVTITEQQPRYQPNVSSTVRAATAPKDVPQSLTIVNEELMKDQQTDTLKGALRNVPGITFEAGEGGRIGVSIRQRGFSVSGDFYLDGIRDIAQYNRDTFNDERIEVLRGSASMLFGRGSTGGVVNQVSKVPRLKKGSEVDVTVGDGSYVRTAGDFNITTSETSALRLNAMTTGGDGRAGKAQTHRRGLAGAYRWNIGQPDEFTVGFYRLDYRDKPDLGGRWLQGIPAPLPRDKWYGAVSVFLCVCAVLLSFLLSFFFVVGC